LIQDIAALTLAPDLRSLRPAQRSAACSPRLPGVTETSSATAVCSWPPRGSGAAAPDGALRAADPSARPRSWRTCGPRRLRRHSQTGLITTLSDTGEHRLVCRRTPRGSCDRPRSFWPGMLRSGYSSESLGRARRGWGVASRTALEAGVIPPAAYRRRTWRLGRRPPVRTPQRGSGRPPSGRPSSSSWPTNTLARAGLDACGVPGMVSPSTSSPAGLNAYGVGGAILPATVVFAIATLFLLSGRCRPGAAPRNSLSAGRRLLLDWTDERSGVHEVEHDIDALEEKIRTAMEEVENSTATCSRGASVDPLAAAGRVVVDVGEPVIESGNGAGELRQRDVVRHGGPPGAGSPCPALCRSCPPGWRRSAHPSADRSAAIPAHATPDAGRRPALGAAAPRTRAGGAG